MINIEFDSIIYSLQKFGGASVYWSNILNRVRGDERFDVAEQRPGRRWRGIPVRTGADVFHSSHFRTTALSRARTVTTVHDLTYELGMLGAGFKAKLNIMERRRSYFDADAIICISENTKKDLLDIYPQLAGKCPIHVIYHGFVAPDFQQQPLMQGLEAGRYLLYVGGRKNYKNFDLALQGFAASGYWRDGIKLVCTGAPFNEDEQAAFKRLGLADAVVSAGLVNEAMLFRLYAHAHCLLYTSRYEGFGLPLIEAMSVGCPVIGARASCIPEIVGDAAILVDADAPDQVAAGIAELAPGEFRQKLINNGLARSSQFSWDASASRHMDVYISMASAN